MKVNAYKHTFFQFIPMHVFLALCGNSTTYVHADIFFSLHPVFSLAQHERVEA